MYPTYPRISCPVAMELSFVLSPFVRVGRRSGFSIHAVDCSSCSRIVAFSLTHFISVSRWRVLHGEVGEVIQ